MKALKIEPFNSTSSDSENAGNRDVVLFSILDNSAILTLAPAGNFCVLSPYKDYDSLGLVENDAGSEGMINWKGFANRNLYDPSSC